MGHAGCQGRRGVREGSPLVRLSHSAWISAPAGKRTVNTEPLPGSLATVTSPPIMRASLRVIARPRPVPPNRWAVVASAGVNSSKSFACCPGVIPMPVSETDSSIQARPSARPRLDLAILGETPHSITSSARASSDGGISRPSARTVLRLITSSNLVDCITGRSAGLAPLRIRPA